MIYTADMFDQIYHEIMGSEQVCYSSLLNTAQLVLYKSVCKWCANDPVLCGRQYEDDIMQEIQIRLIKTCITGFFLRNNTPNYDPVGFKNWMFTVAINIKNDFAKKVRRVQFREVKELEDYDGGGYVMEDLQSNETVDRINKAFEIVLEADVKVYKTLTWLAQMTMIANTDATKIETNNLIITQFHRMTLDQMLCSVLELANHVPWLQLCPSQIQCLRDRLDQPQENGKRLGNMVYNEFFMKKGPKATISDWVNRMNTLVEREEMNGNASHR